MCARGQTAWPDWRPTTRCLGLWLPRKTRDALLRTDGLSAGQEPDGLVSRKHRQTQISATARDVERKLRPVAGIDAEDRRAAVERAIESFCPIDDHKIPGVRAVAQRTVEVVLSIGRARRWCSRPGTGSEGGLAADPGTWERSQQQRVLTDRNFMG